MHMSMDVLAAHSLTHCVTCHCQCHHFLLFDLWNRLSVSEAGLHTARLQVLYLYLTVSLLQANQSPEVAPAHVQVMMASRNSDAINPLKRIPSLPVS